MVMMAMAMGLDSITGASILLLGGAIGFATGTLNMYTTVVAQTIADLPLYSGLWYRAICFAIYYVITNIYLIRYARKIKLIPNRVPCMTWIRRPGLPLEEWIWKKRGK